jgi:hypothetical protein
VQAVQVGLAVLAVAAQGVLLDEVFVLLPIQAAAEAVVVTNPAL